MTDKASFNQALLTCLQDSPTPFHAVASLSGRLERAGFVPLDEADAWDLQPGGRYYVCRNGSAILAFSMGREDPADVGIAMAGAHTDSPCLKIKPRPVTRNQGTVQLGVEVYGGALLNPWFDRDLSIAGRVDYLDENDQLRSGLIDFRRPVAVIPSLAIHLDREANQNRSVNAQTDIPPVLALLDEGEAFDFDALLLQQLHDDKKHAGARRILSHELMFYDTQPAALTGLHGQFISSARLDNLLSCHTAIQALIDADPDQYALVICNDHEEVGSNSTSGAQGPFLASVLERIAQAHSGPARSSREHVERMIRRSLFLSVDNAHAIHPNYADRHDANHGPLMNRGPVIKINSNQRYASNSHSVARFRALCEPAGVPVQSFVVRSDMGCGSTIGPITASGIGVETVDVGVPSFAMHSIREMAGSDDAFYLYQALRPFFSSRP